MIRPKKYRMLILFSIAFMATGIAFSQNRLQPEPDKYLEQAAREISDEWTRELAMSPKQNDLMRKKIIEFELKKQELLQSKMPDEERKKMLVRLQVLEDKDMRDILTKPQYERYLYLRGEQQELRRSEKSANRKRDQ